MSTPPPPAADSWIGRVLAVHYRVDERLGAGAAGTVYRARHTLLDQDFAVKLLSPEASADPAVRRRFLVEARSLAAFTHANAVQVRHCGEQDGVLFLAMDLCRGVSLAALIEREGPLAPRRAATIVAQALDALGEAHRAGIVHRDFKPGNAIVETTRGDDGPVDRVRVVDFGLARIVARSAMPSALTSIGESVVGTVAYMAPEQLRAEDTVDGRADVFSAGVVLHECLSGRLPFDGRSTMSIALRILETPPDALPPEIDASVPPAMHAVLLRALAKDRDERWPTAEAFAAALREAAVGATATAAATATPPPVAKRRPSSFVEPVLDAGLGRLRGSPLSSTAERRSSFVEPVVDATSGTRAGPAPAAHARRRKHLAGILALLALIALAAGGAAWALWPRETDWRARGAAALADGRWSEAVDAYSRAIAKDPTRSEDHLARARGRIALRDVNARADLDEAERGLASDPRVPTERGRYLHLVAKDSAGADVEFRRALTLDGKHLDAREARARMRLDRDDPVGAEQDAAALDRDAPTDPRGPMLAAKAAIRRHDRGAREPAAAESAVAAAMAAADKAVARDPQSAEAALVRAEVARTRALDARAAQRHDDARAALKSAIEDATRAIELARTLPRRWTQGGMLPDALRVRADLHYTAHDAASAVKDMEARVALDPDDPDLRAALEFMRQQAGDETVKEGFERLYDVSGDPDALFRQGFAHQEEAAGKADVGDVAGAIESFDRAIAIYDQGAERFPQHDAMSPYGAEARTLKARLLPAAQRKALLADAGVRFAMILGARPLDSETSLRAAEHALAIGDATRAWKDANAAIKNVSLNSRTPRFDQVLAQAAAAVLEAGGEPLAEAGGPVVVGRAGQDAATNAMAALPEIAPRTLLLRAVVRLRRAGVATDDAARARFVSAAREDVDAAEKGADGSKDVDPTRIRIAADFRRGEIDLAVARAAPAADRAPLARAAAARVRAAIDARAAQQAARRWIVDGAWFDVLAAAHELAGDAAAARAARDEGADLPR